MDDHAENLQSQFLAQMSDETKLKLDKLLPAEAEFAREALVSCMAAELMSTLGEGEVLDFNKVVEWLSTHADRGDAQSQFYLGRCYDEGLGVDKDSKQALAWYSKSAEQGNAEAMELIKTTKQQLNIIPRPLR